MYRFYKITLNEDGSEHPSVDLIDDQSIAEGTFEFEMGLAMESGKFTFLMLLDNIGQIHKNYIAMLGEGEIKPRLIEVKIKDTEETKSYVHSTNDEVRADFYKRLGGAKKTTNIKATMLRGVGSKGEQLEYEYWVRPIEATEETA